MSGEIARSVGELSPLPRERERERERDLAKVVQTIGEGLKRFL
jgi:hypothetical protein